MTEPADTPQAQTGLVSTELSAQQVQAVHMICDKPGISNQRVAKALGCGRTTIINWRKDPLFRRVLAEEMTRWEIALRDERLSGKRVRLRILSDEIERMMRLRRKVEMEIGDEVRVSGAIVSAVEKASKEMRDTRLGATQVQNNPTAPDPTAPDFPKRLANWLERVVSYMQWDADSFSVRQLIDHLEGAKPVAEEAS